MKFVGEFGKKSASRTKKPIANGTKLAPLKSPRSKKATDQPGYQDLLSQDQKDIIK